MKAVITPYITFFADLREERRRQIEQEDGEKKRQKNLRRREG